MMTEGEEIPEAIARLVRASVDSPQRLDILLHLRSAGGRPACARTVAGACQLTIAAAEEHLAVLCGRGFLTVSIGGDLLYTYEPMNPALDREVADVATLVERNRIAALTALRLASRRR